LEVGVHEDHCVAAGMVESGGDGGTVSEIAAGVDYLDAAGGVAGEGVESLRAPVGAAVVDEDDLITDRGAKRAIACCTSITKVCTILASL